VRFCRYLVGGAVRDHLLGKAPADRDFVVVGSTPEEMDALGFKPVGASFRVYLDPETGEEHALARRERKIAPGHRGFEIEFGPEVTLEEDLSRRDLTVNAIAMDPESGEIFDPLGGRADLESKTLRAANPSAFADDPVRVLRLARFAATLGFEIEAETLALARVAVEGGELASEPGERIYQEATLALTKCSTPSVFFRVLEAAGALAVVLPELHALIGVEQPAHGHPEGDAFEHTMMVIDAAALGLPEVAWAALCHDFGKALTPREEWPAHHRHEKRGLVPIEAALRRLKAPNEVLDFSLSACRHHMRMHRWRELRAGTVLEIVAEFGGLRGWSGVAKFLKVCDADTAGRDLPEDGAELRDRERFFLEARHRAASVLGKEILARAAESAARRGVPAKAPGAWVGDALLAARIRSIGSISREVPA